MNASGVSPLVVRLFDGTWSQSWQAAVLIIMVLLAQWVTRKWLTASWRYALWLLVVVRLLLPFSAASPLSIYNVVRRDAKIHVAPALPSTATPALPRALPAPTKAGVPSVAPGSRIDLPASVSPPVSGGSARPPAIPVVSVPVERLPALTRATDWQAVAAWTWLAGAAVFAVFAHWTTWRFLQRVRRAPPIDDPRLTALLDQCRRQLRVYRTVTLHETPFVKSPALFGVWRPRLLLPPGLTQRFTPAELRYVFLHEMAHVKRRDVAVNWLLTFLQAIHWFNPLVWFGFARMRADRELACDAMALSCSNEDEAKTYGLTIVKLLEGFARPAASPGLVGILESRHQMTRRIRLIANFRPRRQWSWLAAAVMGVLAVTGLTDAVRSSHAQEAPKPGSDAKKALRLTVLDAETGQPVPGAEVVPGYSQHVTFSVKPDVLHTDPQGVAIIPCEGNESGFSCGVFSADHAARSLELWYPSDRTKPEVPGAYTVKLERGASIGGILRDDAGQPLANVRVAVTGFITARSYSPITKPQIMEFPCYDPMFCSGAATKTDADGRWACPHFSAGQGVRIDFERADGAFARFHSPCGKWETGLGGATIDAEPAWHGELVSVFPPGIDVRGTVTDAGGGPLAGVTVTETDGRHLAGPVSKSETGADGRFVLPGRDPHQLSLMLTGPGLSPRVEVVQVAPGMAEMSLSMHPATALRVRFVDTEGQPVSGTEIRSSENPPQWKATSGADGRTILEAASVEPESYQVAAPGFGPRVLSLAATGAEQTITLRRGDPPGVLVTVRATDASGHGLGTFTVTGAYQTNGGMSEVYDRYEALGPGRAGVATVLVPVQSSQQMDFRLKVESPGHEPFTSEPLDALPHDLELTAALTPAVTQTGATAPGRDAGGDHARVTLCLPDGKPAAGASVVINDSSSGHNSYIMLSFFDGSRPRAEGEHKKTVVADGAGSVTLPTGAADTPTFVLHDDAYLFTTLGRLRQAAETTLDAWGRVEGTFTLDGHPRTDQRLNLQPNHGDGVHRLSYLISVSTDRSGHFVFDRVPGDDFMLSCTQVSAGQWPQNHTLDVHVTPGQTTRLAYDATGRTLTGQIKVAPADAEIDWKQDVGDCLLTAQPTGLPPDPVSARPAYQDFVRFKDYKRADAAYLDTHRFADSSERHDTYGPTFDADGNFRFEGVEPGTYEFNVELRKKQLVNQQWQQQTLGTLKRTVVVPPPAPEHADAPVDLGSLEVAIDAAAAPKRPAVAFAARALDGQVVDLANYRGKPVLLMFWASWAPPTPSQINAWKSAVESAADGRLVALGLSMDDDPVRARQFAQDHGLPGTQARLEGRAKAAVTEALAIDELPITILVGADGHVRARDLSGPRLRDAVDTALTVP